MHLYLSNKDEWWFVVRVDIYSYLSSLLTSGARCCGWSVPNPEHFTPWKNLASTVQ